MSTSHCKMYSTEAHKTLNMTNSFHINHRMCRPCHLIWKQLPYLLTVPPLEENFIRIETLLLLLPMCLLLHLLHLEMSTSFLLRPLHIKILLLTFSLLD